MEKSRSKNAFSNLISGAMLQVVIILFGFISRTVFIHVLGKQYLGISGLFTSVLTFLSLSELGIGSGIVYCIYKPLATKDYKKLQAYMKIYKRAYQIIGCVVLLAGLILIPFLPYLIKDYSALVDMNVNIVLIFCMYLFQSVSSYWFFAYRSSIITADQKDRIVSRINAFATAFTSLLGIAILLIFKNFILYLGVSIFKNIFGNIIIAYYSKKLYPQVWVKNNEKLTKDEVSSLKKKVFGLSLYNICKVALTSTDNMVISGFMGLAILGVYDNYHAIIGYVGTIVAAIFNSLTAGLGNVNAVEVPEKRHSVFKNVSFMNFWIYGFCGIGILCLSNQFIALWAGNDYLLEDFWCLLILFIDFVTEGLQQTVIVHVRACGLFWEGKMRPLISTILNITLSVLAVKPFGIVGVIGATIVSRMAVTWWFDPYILFKHIFKTSPKSYYITYIKRFIFVCAVCAVNYGFCLGIDYLINLAMTGLSARITAFALQIAVTIVFPNVCFWLVSRKSTEYICLLYSVSSLFGKKLGKKSKKIAKMCDSINKRYFALRDQGLIL